MTRARRVCLLGLGEVGGMIVADLGPGACSIAAFDPRFGDPQSPPAATLWGNERVRGEACASDAARDADLIVSVVTAGQSLVAARSVAGALPRGCRFLDLNSVAPSTRRATAVVIDGAGGRYVEGAIMAPFAQARLASPILLGGPHARRALPVLRSLGFVGASVWDAEVGRAAAVKLCRSVIVKGFGALVCEALLTARRHGVEAAVLDSLGDLFPHPDWSAHARYLIGRSLTHGQRRAEEMREAAETVREAGLDAWMAQATVARQAWAAGVASGLTSDDLAVLLDGILEHIDATGTGR